MNLRRMMLLAVPAVMLAQTQVRQEVRVFNTVTDSAPRMAMAMAGGGDNVHFMAAEFGSEKAVKGAPYSAEAITEHTQTLADGNRIVEKSTAVLYRDGEGRTRREQQVGSKTIIMIHDVVAGKHYILNPEKKTATTMGVRTQVLGPAKANGEKRDVIIETIQGPGPMGHVMALPPDAAVNGGEAKTVTMVGVAGAEAKTMTMVNNRIVIAKTAGEASKVEQLGTRMIEGVQCEGKKVTTTIPAGQIGNERPIEMVLENWYSPELQTMVSTKSNDPRMGETAYKLTKVQRSEPSRTLFEVPADYTIEENKPVIMEMRKGQKQE